MGAQQGLKSNTYQVGVSLLEKVGDGEMNIDELLSVYSKQIKVKWELTPENEADILNISAIRDEIHQEYKKIEDPAKAIAIKKKIRSLDQEWQEWVKNNTNDSFRMSYPAAGAYWWYNLDKLEEYDLQEI
jgi:protein-tyrosine-phosphatase